VRRRRVEVGQPGLRPGQRLPGAFDGGAGALHGADIARELSIPAVIVPPYPGITSAMGCLLVDVQHDVSQMFLRDAKEADPAEIEQAFTELEAEGRERLRHEGVAEADMMFQRFVDMRYRGQWRSLAVPMPGKVESMDDAIAIFHDLYQREHNFRREEFPAEIYRLTLKAVGVTPKPPMPQAEVDENATATPKGTRPVRFDGHPEAIETPLYDRGDLVPGVVLHGPAVIDQLDSTTLVPPGTTASVDSWENIRIDIEEKQA
jgi:N-methylhydantoinase A